MPGKEVSPLRGRWHTGNAPRLDWRLSVCLVLLFLVLVWLGLGDRRPVRALLFMSIVERAIFVIGTRLRRESWLARPYLGWGHVTEATVALAALGFVLSEPVFGHFWTLQSFWVEFWQVASMATLEGYLVVLIWQVFRRVRIATIVATAITAVGAVLLAIVLSGLLAEAIRYFGA